ncbi:MAG TPA: hypothetical protein PKK43_01700 [Spirochaetota bacterium]|nr:hypothetical protein [Spirochaetota bacterium]
MGMVFYVTGAKKFLIGGIMFAVTGPVMGYGLLSSGNVKHPVFIVILSSIVFLLGVSELLIAYDMRKNRLSSGAVDIPAKYRFFIIGYLFTAAGVLLLCLQIAFGFVPPGIAVKVALWSSTAIFLTPGVVCLVIFFKSIGSKISEAVREKKESVLSSIIGAAVGSATIYSMTLSISAVLAEKAGAGTVLTIIVMCIVSVAFCYLAYRVYRFFSRKK